MLGVPTPIKTGNLEPHELAERAAELALSGGSAQQLRRETEISEKAAETIMRVCKMTPAEFSEVFRSKAQRVIDKAMTELEKKIDEPKISAAQLSVTIGVLSDKIGSLGANKGPQSVHLHLHGGTEAEKRRMLGNALGAAIRPDTRSANSNKRLKPAAPIEVEPPHPPAPSDYQSPEQ